MSKHHDQTRKTVSPPLSPEYGGEGENVEPASQWKGTAGLPDCQSPRPLTPTLSPEYRGEGAIPGGASGEKMGEYFATLGPPCTRSRGEEMGEFFATGGAKAGDTSAGEGAASEPPRDEIKSLRHGVPLAVPPERRGRGRPTVMDERLKEEVCLLLSLGLSRRQAASYLNIVHGTIANAVEREPEFAARVARAEQMAVIKPILTVAAASQKNYRAAIWLINRNERLLKKTDEELREEQAEEVRRAREDGERFAATLEALDEGSRGKGKAKG